MDYVLGGVVAGRSANVALRRWFDDLMRGKTGVLGNGNWHLLNERKKERDALEHPGAVSLRLRRKATIVRMKRLEVYRAKAISVNRLESRKKRERKRESEKRVDVVKIVVNRWSR